MPDGLLNPVRVSPERTASGLAWGSHVTLSIITDVDNGYIATTKVSLKIKHAATDSIYSSDVAMMLAPISCFSVEVGDFIWLEIDFEMDNSYFHWAIGAEYEGDIVDTLIQPLNLAASLGDFHLCFYCNYDEGMANDNRDHLSREEGFLRDSVFRSVVDNNLVVTTTPIAAYANNEGCNCTYRLRDFPKESAIAEVAEGIH